MTLADALAAAAKLGLERLDAHLLLLHALGRGPGERAWLVAHDTDELPDTAARAFDALCERRRHGEPVAYLLGHKEFFGMEFMVDARVLVPRPETEILVEWALDILKGRSQPSVVDLGTGSGAIALAIKKHRPDARVVATDSSFDALNVARGNAALHGLDIGFLRGTWLEPVQGKHGLIVSNPPYVRDTDRELAHLRHEPSGALTAGPDGLDDIRAIIAQAPGRLAPGGWLLLEHGWDQFLKVKDLLVKAGFDPVQYRLDLAGMWRCAGGQWVEPR